MQSAGCVGAPVKLGLSRCQEYVAGDPIQLLGSVSKRIESPLRAGQALVNLLMESLFIYYCLHGKVLLVPALQLRRRWESLHLDAVV